MRFQIINTFYSRFLKQYLLQLNIRKMNPKLSSNNQNLTQIKSLISQYKNLLKNLTKIQSKIISNQEKLQDIHQFTKSQIKIPSQKSTKSTTSIQKVSQNHQHKKKHKIHFIRQNIIGLTTQFTSPYNIKLQTVYVDHTATNRPYAPIETMINYTKRFVANPHTEFSHFGKYSTQMMHYAENSLLKSFNADPEKYVILPTGSGSTGAVEKAIRLIEKIEDFKNPQIFITPYEHHSNILPWVEFYGHVTKLESDQKPVLLIDNIEDQIKNSEKKSIIISVSAASNVTSQLTQLKALNEIIRNLREQSKKNIIFAVDCAAYCCHHHLNIKTLDQIDFAFISPHKNLGGAQTCGLLLARKDLISSSTPTFPGGGTVSLVKGYEQNDIIYDMDLFNRQVAGTPPFLGFYRAALSFQLLKNQITYDFIHQRQTHNSKLFLDLLLKENKKFKDDEEMTSIVIYGDCDLEHRANIFTINIVNDGELKNHNFISEIFSDIFGLQVRSGCFCAGPLSIQLLKLDMKMVDHLTPIMQLGLLKDKPGYIRMDITFYLQDYQIEYIVKAISLTAKYCKNMEMIYTICNDGEIKRHKIYKQHFPNNYQLKNFMKLREELKNLQQSDSNRLKNRRHTLQRQLIQGEQILKDPLKFMRNQISTHKI